jgi:hypothetical protein
MTGIPFGTTDWPQIDPTEHPGETGTAFWRTQTFGDLRVRMVDYTPGYLSSTSSYEAAPHTPLRRA